MTHNIGLFRIGGQMEIVGDPTPSAAGSAYSFTLPGQGGTSPYAFLGVSLPSGWAVSGSGEITHAGPSAGAYSITVQMADSARNTPVQKTFVVKIA